MLNNQPYSLNHIDIHTPDGFSLPGLWFTPHDAAEIKTAALFIHGCGSSSVFYKQEKMDIFARQLAAEGIHFLAFNNRGAHYIKKLKQHTDNSEDIIEVKIGTALEKIEDCVHDIDGAIAFLHEQGIEKIILIGESTGANKFVVYNHYKPENAITAYAGVGGGDDMGLWAQQFGFDQWREVLNKAKSMIDDDKGHYLHSANIDDGIMSYTAIYDVLNPDGDYNCFPYTEHFRKEKWSKQPLFHYWSEITKPTLMLYGSEDPFTCVSPQEAVTALQEFAHQDAQATYTIIDGADHSFSKHVETEISEIIAWWRTL